MHTGWLDTRSPVHANCRQLHTLVELQRCIDSGAVSVCWHGTGLVDDGETSVPAAVEMLMQGVCSRTPASFRTEQTRPAVERL
jgi:hypothetical protein